MVVEKRPKEVLTSIYSLGTLINTSLEVIEPFTPWSYCLVLSITIDSVKESE